MHLTLTRQAETPRGFESLTLRKPIKNKNIMENLGLFIYLAGVADAMIIVSIATAIVCAVMACAYMLIGSIDGDDSDHKIAKKCVIILVVCCIVATIVPSKRTCYSIFGITAAIELYKSSESLQQLPEKSVEALNRFLDSIAPEEEND